MNEILLSKLRTGVVEPLKGIVKWDRYGIREEDDSGFIFGWIGREDKFYDFVVVRFWVDWSKGPTFYCNYDTSSKKYSKEIGLILGSNLEGYVPCRSAREIIRDEDLVRWQKVATIEPIESL